MRLRLFKVNALRLWSLMAVICEGGASLVDLVFDEVPSVSNTDELLVITNAQFCCCSLCLPPNFYPRASFIPRQTDSHYNYTVLLKGQATGRLREEKLSGSFVFASSH